MYADIFEKSLKAVAENRENNISCEIARMTADEKEKLLAAYHPDYRQSQFSPLRTGAPDERDPRRGI